MIIDIDDVGNKSIKRLLNYLPIDGHSGIIRDSNYATHIWDIQILPYIQSIKTHPDFIKNPSYQKEQFKRIHDEVMWFLREKFTGIKRESYINAIK